MLVEQIMNKDVITLHPNDTIRAAIQIMRQCDIRHLPIVNNEEKVVGIVTERDLKAATPLLIEGDKAQEQLEMPVSSIMVTDVITGHPLDFVEEVALIFYDHKIGCLPIVSNGKLVGIITGTDLLHTLVELTGANQPGSQIEIKVENRKGVLYEVTGVFNKLNVNVHSVLVYPDPMSERHKILVFRVATMNTTKLVLALKNERLNVLWPSMPGTNQ